MHRLLGFVLGVALFLTPVAGQNDVRPPAVAIAAAPARAAGQTAAPPSAGFPTETRIQNVRQYIRRMWSVLTRSTRDLARAAPDPKVHVAAGEAWPVYVAADEDREAIARTLRTVLSPDDVRQIDLRQLPAAPNQIREQGLLYLPHPYVVPGGRFNEMYGWDSYFIARGLLRDNEIGLARDMTDNFLYEIGHYGMILNANRTYFLTRSQPPFLTEMILGVYERTNDRQWLRSTLPAIDRYYAFWTTPPHRVDANGLSRYFDLGDGPAPEVVAAERDAQGLTHYDRVRDYFRSHEVMDYDVSQFYDRAADRLSALFYKGDRSMRESGFDPSNRFGPFSADIIHYTPVCLNVLLYRMEEEASRIHSIVGSASAAAEWRARAERRRQGIDSFLWDPEAGLYFDYNFETRQRRRYEFATTFYPLWAGIAKPDQARRVVANLPKFEAPGGLLTSTVTSGSQWDSPYGWAPLQLIAVEGLRRYGFNADADRLARKFLSLVVDDFDAHGTIVEKYDVRRRSSDLGSGLHFGYTSNEAGFGWTNAAVLDLLAGLNRTRRAAAGANLGVRSEPPRRDVGRFELGIGIRAGAPRADIRTPAALKKTLQDTPSITYPQDGASRGTIERMLEQMGIAADVKPKIILAPGSGPATESVAAGKAAMVITLFSEIVPIHGVEVLGALPGEYQSDIRFAAATSTTSQNGEAAKALIAFLSGPRAAPVLKAKGIEPR